MKIRISRGFAVLALLCLVPRASALTIVQTATFDKGGSGYIGFGMGDTWLYQGFNPALGTLTGVQLTADFTTTLTIVEVNNSTNAMGVFPGPPLVWHPTGNVAYSILSSDSDNLGGLGLTESISVSRPPVTLQAFEMSVVSETVHKTITKNYTSAADLARFSGLLPSTLAGPAHRMIVGVTGSSPSFYAVPSGTTHAELRLEYTFSVPDSGSTALLCALVAITGAFHRRLFRRPGRV